MSRHLADHNSGSSTGRTPRFLLIDRQKGPGMWQSLWQNKTHVTGNRRLVEFLRVAREEARE